MRLVFTAAALFCALAITGCAGLKWSLGYNPSTQQWTVSGELPPPKSLKK